MPKKEAVLARIVKRDGRTVPFDRKKITFAIEKAASAVGRKIDAAALTEQVVRILAKRFQKKPPHVEDVQDVVEQTLIGENLADVAKAYILYRKKREELREAKRALEVRDELKITLNAAKVLQARYLLRDETGRIIESPAQMLRRVARAIAAVEKKYDKKADLVALEEEFYQSMASLDFLPNTPTLMNAGTKIGQLSACFVLPIGDSLVEIFDTLKHMALIHQSGGGTGFSFSRLRPKGDIVRSTKGVASGPVSFMRIFDMATEIIKQGGKRRGANMGALDVSHPDILDFITAKTTETQLQNFNISVMVSDAFMKAVQRGESYELINPRTRKPTGKLNARDVFDLIVHNAWRTGDPGLLFIDEINRRNPTAFIGKITATNPCGEQPLHDYESCNLGSINLANMVEPDEREINWVKLKRRVRTAVQFLDNVIDANRYVLPQIRAMTRANRRIGLGVMGFAEALIKLGIPYDSEDALRAGERIMSFISREARKRSVELGESKGSFPNFKRSTWAKDYRALRNATLTTIAPTGTISIIAGCSSGIEPLFAIAFVRTVLEGARLFELNPLFEVVARHRGFYSTELMRKIAETGSCTKIDEVPEDVRRLFVTALDIAPEWHVRMQAAFQRHTDNAVSKTVNLPHNATVEDVRKVYLLAHKLGCKGITVFRYGSKKAQVMYTGAALTRELEAERFVSAEAEFAGGCPVPICPH